MEGREEETAGSSTPPAANINYPKLSDSNHALVEDGAFPGLRNEGHPDDRMGAN